jgi:ribonuclease HII
MFIVKQIMNARYENQKLKQGYEYIIGCDEVGRGSLAGPVVAAAVVFDFSKIKDKGLRIRDINDSKLLASEKREVLSENIKHCSLAWSIAEVPPEEIDVLNIHHASLLAMKKAVDSLLCHPGLRSGIHGPTGSQTSSEALGFWDDTRTWLAVDGKFIIPNLSISQEAVVEGDGKILSVAAASIIAKVYRDDLMRKLHLEHPNYNFAKHKGYATELHREKILQYGLSPVHRLTFCKSFA